MVELNNLQPAVPRQRRKRVGRGIGSGLGKTSGKGQKGQKARSGGVKGRGFEGGQMPLQRRLPRRGFSNAPFRRVFATVNVGDLARFAAGTVVDAGALEAARLVRGRRDGIKILGEGDLGVPLTVRVDAFSAAARAKIVAAGGSAEAAGDLDGPAAPDAPGAGEPAPSDPQS